MSAVNGAALVGNMLGYPVPHVPKKWREKANAAVGGLDKASSVAEFDALQQSLDRSGENADGKDTTKALRGHALRELTAFIEEKDAKHNFSGMRRLVTPEGQACWTLKTKEQLTKEERTRIDNVSLRLSFLQLCFVVANAVKFQVRQGNDMQVGTLYSNHYRLLLVLTSLFLHPKGEGGTAHGSARGEGARACSSSEGSGGGAGCGRGGSTRGRVKGEGGAAHGSARIGKTPGCGGYSANDGPVE
jgi:hypothetical protein